MTGPDALTDEEFEEQLRRALKRDAYSRPVPPQARLAERVQASLTTRRGSRMVAFAATAAAAVVFVAAGLGLASRLTGPDVIAQGTSPSQSPTRSAASASSAPSVGPNTTSAPPSATEEASASPSGPMPMLPLFAHEPGSVGFQARAVGVLAYDENRCLVLNTDWDVTFYLAWPWPGTEWDPLTGTVAVEGATAEVGSRVALGGGTISAPSSESESWVNPPADACWRASYYLVFVVTDTE